MFSGIIEKKARILTAEPSGQLLLVRIEKPRAWKLARGQSVNVDGVCSTVMKSDASSFSVEYMPETLSKTTVGAFVKGRPVNLERSLTYGQRIDGHPVQGHVDTAVPVREIKNLGKSREIIIKPNAMLARQIMLHGSIAINGVSLTVARKRGQNVTVALIPHSLKETNLGALVVGNLVNIEFDHTAEYLAALRKK